MFHLDVLSSKDQITTQEGGLTLKTLPTLVQIKQVVISVSRMIHESFRNNLLLYFLIFGL